MFAKSKEMQQLLLNKGAINLQKFWQALSENNIAVIVEFINKGIDLIIS